MRTVDGGSCLQTKVKDEREPFFIRKGLTEIKEKKEVPIDPKDMTPYQKHMKHNRFKSTIMDKD